MSDVEYERQSFGIVAQFPQIFSPGANPFSGKMTYSVVFDYAELPAPARWFVKGHGEHNRVRANSNFAPPLVELSGQQHRLQMLLELAEASNIKHRLLTLQPISITIKPYVVRHPLTRVPVALSLDAVGLYATNLETHYEKLMDELREELR